MDRKSFCQMFNMALFDRIITTYCLEKGKSVDETSLFIDILHIKDPDMTIRMQLVDFIADDISKTDPITFLYNTQHQLLKVF